jgi:hypothetical protein
VVYCPVCNAELSNEMQTCFVCGHDSENSSEIDEEWIVLGIIEDKLHADLAKETLKSCNIPAVIFSRSGFFGNIGLMFNPFYSDHSPAFEIQVPENYIEEAANVLDSTLGEKWQRKRMAN